MTDIRRKLERVRRKLNEAIGLGPVVRDFFPDRPSTIDKLREIARDIGAVKISGESIGSDSTMLFFEYPQGADIRQELESNGITMNWVKSHVLGVVREEGGGTIGDVDIRRRTNEIAIEVMR